MALSEQAKDKLYEAIEPVVVCNPERAFSNIARLRTLALAADTARHVFGGYEVPSADVSEAVLKFMANTHEAVGWLATKITLDSNGCWTLPLKAEYDDKNRARYPTLSSRTFNAKGELAHRFVLRRVFGAPLTRNDQWDHICRNHSCCSVLDGEIVTPRTNCHRALVAQRSVAGEQPLF